MKIYYYVKQKLYQSIEKISILLLLLVVFCCCSSQNREDITKSYKYISSGYVDYIKIIDSTYHVGIIQEDSIFQEYIIDEIKIDIEPIEEFIGDSVYIYKHKNKQILMDENLTVSQQTEIKNQTLSSILIFILLSALPSLLILCMFALFIYLIYKLQ